VGKGWTIGVSAGVTPRTLALHVGAWAARGKLTATLSDGSARPVSDTSFDGGLGSGETLYVIKFGAAAEGQILTVTWTVDELTGDARGDVRLQAATLR
jgi:hypothetical protein